MNTGLIRLQSALGYQFKDQDLLKLALTHRSAHSKQNYERLEFLGDALLSAVIASHLFTRHPSNNEGKLTRLRANLVRQESLGLVAKDLKLSDYLTLGAGELKAGGRMRESILSDVVESIIGAMYLDSGSFETVEARVLCWFESLIERADQLKILKDAKSRLQELLQSQSKQLPTYTLVKCEGQAPLETFFVECHANNQITHAQGKSRKLAEQQAAELMLMKLSTKEAKAL